MKPMNKIRSQRVRNLKLDQVDLLEEGFIDHHLFSYKFNHSAPRFLRHEYDDEDEVNPHIRTIIESLRDSGLGEDFDLNDISSPRIRNAIMRQALTPQSRASRSTRRTPESVSL